MQGAAMCFRPELLSLKRDTCALMVYNGPQVYKSMGKIASIMCRESYTQGAALAGLWALHLQRQTRCRLPPSQMALSPMTPRIMAK